MPRQIKSRAAPKAGKRHPLNMRTTKDVRDRLEKAAAAAGRSLAQEVEYRIERSIRDDELLPYLLELAYGRETAGTLMLLAKAILGADQHRGLRWLRYPADFQRAVNACVEVFEAIRPEKMPSQPEVRLVPLRPDGTSAPTDEEFDEMLDSSAKHQNIALLRAMTRSDVDRRLHDQRQLDIIRNMLGPEMKARIAERIE